MTTLVKFPKEFILKYGIKGYVLRNRKYSKHILGEKRAIQTYEIGRREILPKIREGNTVKIIKRGFIPYQHTIEYENEEKYKSSDLYLKIILFNTGLGRVYNDYRLFDFIYSYEQLDNYYFIPLKEDNKKRRYGEIFKEGIKISIIHKEIDKRYQRIKLIEKGEDIDKVIKKDEWFFDRKYLMGEEIKNEKPEKKGLIEPLF